MTRSGKPDKRLLKKVIQTPRKCLWCEELMDIGTRSPAQYNIIKVHKKCVTSWSHYKCAKSIAELETNRDNVRCEACNVVMVRRDNEHLQAWVKRRFCNKSCSAKRSSGNRVYRVPIEVLQLEEEQRSHVKRYIPGTAEFERLATHYLERGF